MDIFLWYAVHVMASACDIRYLTFALLCQEQTGGPQSDTQVASDNDAVLDGNIQPGAGEEHVPKVLISQPLNTPFGF